MTTDSSDAIAEVTGCHQTGWWCETHSADWPCKVGQIQRLIQPPDSQTVTTTRTTTAEYDDEGRFLREVTVTVEETGPVDDGPREGDRVRLTYGDGSTVEGTWRAVLELDGQTLHTHTRGHVRRDVVARGGSAEMTTTSRERVSRFLSEQHNLGRDDAYEVWADKKRPEHVITIGDLWALLAAAS